MGKIRRERSRCTYGWGRICTYIYIYVIGREVVMVGVARTYMRIYIHVSLIDAHVGNRRRRMYAGKDRGGYFVFITLSY